MTTAERKRVELIEKAGSLARELERWREACQAGQPLARHATQIQAVAGILDTIVAPERARLDAWDGDGEALLAQALAVERTILGAHRLWEFFRAKLALRYVPWFEDYLLAADELAWACYEPAQARVPDGLGREPPLVFLNGGSSPFTLPRGSSFVAEEVPGEAPRGTALRRALQSLPVPVVGVPWLQVAHLPDAPVIGHEVGHDVELDLGLGETLDALLDGALAQAPAERRRAWRAWRSELFADVYGTLATGPAFVGALIDFLADDPRDVARERVGSGSWGDYPTRTLRVLVCLEVLTHRGLRAERAELHGRWTSTYGSHAAVGHERDVAPVARALLDGPYPQLGDGPLTTLLDFTAERQAEVTRAAEGLLDRRTPRELDARTTLAATRQAYERDPNRYVARDCGSRVLRGIREYRPTGPRAAGDARPVPLQREARDAVAAQRIAALLAVPTTDEGGTDVQAHDV